MSASIAAAADETADEMSAPAAAHPPAYKAADREIYLWGTSQVTNTLIGSLGANLTPFFNTTLGLNAGLIGIASVIPRLLDALIDPFIGHLSDNTHTRWGRRRPFIVLGGVLTAVFMSLIWWASPAWSTPALFVWLIVVLLLFSISTSIIGVPTEALGLELTDDYHQRTKVQTVKFFYGSIAGLAVPWVYWLTLRPAWGGELNGFRAVYAIVAGLIIGFAMLPAIFCRERFQRANRQHEPVRDGLRSALKNPYFRQLVYVRLSNSLTATIVAGMNFYINVYYVCRGNKEQAMKISGVGGTMYGLLSFGFLFVTPWIGRTIGKRHAMLTGFVLQLVLAVIQPWIQTPDHPYLQLVGVAVAVPAGLMANIFVSSFMPDVCDLGEVQSGRRMEGTYGAVAGLFSKIEYTLLAVVVGFMINLSGFDPGAASQSVAVQNHIRWLAYGPGFASSVLTFWLAWRFKVNQQLMDATRNELNARHIARSGQIGVV